MRTETEWKAADLSARARADLGRRLAGLEAQAKFCLRVSLGAIPVAFGAAAIVLCGLVRESDPPSLLSITASDGVIALQAVASLVAIMLLAKAAVLRRETGILHLTLDIPAEALRRAQLGAGAAISAGPAGPDLAPVLKEVRLSKAVNALLAGTAVAFCLSTLDGPQNICLSMIGLWSLILAASQSLFRISIQDLTCRFVERVACR
ncbi:hypothetical protein LAZ40_04275 [Cereibacter sphaeroides]|uniref:hypothetical protein n=1 Tax=Cereibacter sphaeroides TaxID=1063 RepID=UPI001F16B7A5|nr:hypothetical protein [Cereibacter sphaeroides]MCE6958271.1 hypothetical protein [Cereibacter sphaeroides]MCE6971334.1 hypothetical protein [Cereibacter sphaeroides]